MYFIVTQYVYLDLRKLGQSMATWGARPLPALQEGNMRNLGSPFMITKL